MSAKTRGFCRKVRWIRGMGNGAKTLGSKKMSMECGGSLEGEHRETLHSTDRDRRVPKTLVPHLPEIPTVVRW